MLNIKTLQRGAFAGGSLLCNKCVNKPAAAAAAID